mgnify:CR=1 FL=1
MDKAAPTAQIKPMSDPAETLNDRSKLGDRMARYTGVGGTMAGLAAKLAGQKFLGLNIDKDVHAADLTAALGNLKGPLMKIGQILSTIPEALPKEYADALQQLQSNAPPMGWSFVRRRMNTELGMGWESRFADFPHEATNAASLGQVHKAKLPDGRTVACKLQYPDMSSAIEADLRQLKIVFSIYEMYDKAIKTGLVLEEIGDRLREELDYKREADNIRLYQTMLDGVDGVHVPRVVDELSTNRLLTMEWLDGEKILSFKDAPIETRNRIAMNLFQAWYVPLYHYGFIHGDPHLGNYTVRSDDLSLNLLDFGCVRVFPPQFIGAVIELYRALQANDEARLVAAFETWGFKDLSREMIDILSTWARFLYGPLLDDKARIIGEAKGGMYGKETAAEVHARLKETGGVTVPREFVFMDRAALGLGSVFIHLKAEVNWHRIFEEMIDGFDEATLAANQRKLLDGNPTAY